MIDGNDVIGPFEGEYRFLSNFYEAEFRWAGYKWPTSEHAYQASKAKTMDGFYEVVKCKTPGQAKRAGRKVQIVDDWDDMKLHIMFEVCFAKFSQNTDLLHKLLQTKDKEIVELNPWNDTFWGRDIDTGQGLNALGRILMSIRRTFRSIQQIEKDYIRYH